MNSEGLQFSNPQPDFEGASAGPWRKSSRSQTSNCVEVAPLGNEVAVRDSKDHEGPVLTFNPEAWGGFIAAIGASAISK